MDEQKKLEAIREGGFARCDAALNVGIGLVGATFILRRGASHGDVSNVAIAGFVLTVLYSVAVYQWHSRRLGERLRAWWQLNRDGIL